MPKRMLFAENPFKPWTWQAAEADSFGEALRSRYPKWPRNARLYDLHGFDHERTHAAMDLARRDVTPRDRDAVQRLDMLEGPLLMAIPPGDFVSGTLLIIAAITALAVAAVYLLLPKIPKLQNRTAGSSNNSLSERVNRPRPNGRIPDIYGTVVSVPDLIALPYTEFANNVEMEIAVMCIGRGAYDIDKIKDGDTLISAISGSGIEIYGPYTSPNGYEPPEIQIGTPIARLIVSAVRLNEVNGQTLRPPNSNFVKGDGTIRFIYPDTIEINDSTIDLTESFAADDEIIVSSSEFEGPNSTGSIQRYEEAYCTVAGVIEFISYDPTADFSAGQTVTLSNAGFVGSTGSGTGFVDLAGAYVILSLDSASITLTSPSTVNPDWDAIYEMVGGQTESRSLGLSRDAATVSGDLAGTYVALAVTSTHIVLSNPSLVNPAWSDLAGLTGGATEYLSPNLSTTGSRSIGEFIVEAQSTSRIQANFVAPGGLLKDNGKKQEAVSVTVQLTATPVDEDDNPIGAPEVFSETLEGSKTNRDQVGVTLYCDLANPGRQKISVERITATDLDYKGTVIDDVKWRDVYGISPVEQSDFGNVTILMTRTYATNSAITIKERKINMEVTRKVPERIYGDMFGDPVPSARLDDIISAMALDPKIGGMTADQVDFDNIYGTVAEVEDYFGSAEAVTFGYTYDDDNMSAQDMLAIAAQAGFCTPYRQSAVLRLTFEKATSPVRLLFNARNTIPETQHRAIKFGIENDYDGVLVAYIDPDDGTTLSFVAPPDAINPRKNEIPGLRSSTAANWHAWRLWYRMRHQSLSIKFDGTDEASGLIRNDRIVCADLTRAETVISAEVIAQDGDTLTLSQPAAIDEYGDWTIFLQHKDGTVESLGVTPGSTSTEVVLSAPPRMALSVDPANARQSVYKIARDDDPDIDDFIVLQRERSGSEPTHTITAIGYNFMFYASDQLELWLAFLTDEYLDWSAHDRDPIPPGYLAQYDDARLKFVHVQTDAYLALDLPVFDPPESYTKMVWLRANTSQTSDLLGNLHEFFGFSGSSIEVAHEGVTVASAAFIPANWHHAAVSYDASAGTMDLYIDSVLVDAVEGVPARALGPLIAFDGFVGKADDLRLYARALTQSEIEALYTTTRVPFETSTWDSDEITFDDSTITWDSE